MKGDGMTTEKIRAEIEQFKDRIAELPNMADSYCAVDFCLQIIDKYASEECDNDCEHCAYLECPKEPCEDAVSRQAVLKAIDKWYENNNQLLLSNCVEDLIVDVTELPSVQPKAKTGHWEMKGDSMKCSVCGAWVENHAPRKFCGNCGAEMKGDAE